MRSPRSGMDWNEKLGPLVELVEPLFLERLAQEPDMTNLAVVILRQGNRVIVQLVTKEEVQQDLRARGHGDGAEALDSMCTADTIGVLIGGDTEQMAIVCIQRGHLGAPALNTKEML